MIEYGHDVSHESFTNPTRILTKPVALMIIEKRQHSISFEVL